MDKKTKQEILLEARTKHPDCWFCALRRVTPCHRLRCEVNGRFVTFTRWRARRCKNYTVEVD